ncbi:hypothetical protein H7F33_04795 [Pedobacter sp. PAMC26386]|nr:hypothetical protein H7F33_04795 [Pedobacter sp. PAMC26386]
MGFTSFDSYDFTHTNELNLIFGGNADLSTLFGFPKGAGGSVAKIKGGIVVRAVQLNFAFYIDSSTQPTFKDLADQDFLKREKVNYVTSVEYGRMGMLTIQVDAEKMN